MVQYVFMSLSLICNSNLLYLTKLNNYTNSRNMSLKVSTCFWLLKINLILEI